MREKKNHNFRTILDLIDGDDRKKENPKSFFFLLLLASDSEFCLCSSEKQCLCGGARVLILMMMMMMMMVEHKKKGRQKRNPRSRKRKVKNNTPILQRSDNFKNPLILNKNFTNIEKWLVGVVGGLFFNLLLVFVYC